jgi:cell division protein FtsX
MNMRMSLLGGGVGLLLTGIALWVYGYNVEPTAGQAIGNIFSGNFTDKRNAFMLVGVIFAGVGGASVLGGALTGLRTARA